jgi:hypothetical protein
VAIAGGAELLRVFTCGFDLTLEVFRELRLEDRMRELLEQDRGEVDIRLEVDAFLLEFTDDP